MEILTVDFNRIVTFDHNQVNDARVAGCPKESASVLVDDSVADIYGNTLAGYGFAGVVPIRGDAKIHDNRISTGSPDASGIRLGCGGFTVSSNTITDNSDFGIAAFEEECEGFQATITGNRVSNNGEGVRLTFIGIGVGNPLSPTRVERNFVLNNASNGIHNEGSSPVLFRGNRSLGNGGFDCLDDFFSVGFGGQWQDNTGLTDQPQTLCRPPN